MKAIPAIVEPAQIDIDLCAQTIIVAVADLSNAERAIARLSGHLEAARTTADQRRLEIGRWLVRARPQWPERGPNAKKWGEFLKRVGLEQSTAWRYMELVKPGFMQPHENPADGDRDVKPANPPTLELVPDPESEVDIDRDTWCTPPWITEPLGSFDLDPCSNDRATVPARMQLRLDFGQDGLAGADVVDPCQRVFINPPYSDVQPWIAAYKHTRFCFLLKLDTSTKWFAELYAASALILIPRRRVNFIPPPGVPPEKAIAQQFPHALFYANAEDATDAIRALCWQWRVEHTTT